MPQLQPLVLKDRKATPVDHTFTPVTVDKNGVGEVAERSGVPIGDNRFTISTRRNANGKYVSQLKLVLPSVQNSTGSNGVTQPVLLRTAYVDVTFTFDQTSSEAERNDAVGMLASSLEPTKLLVNDTVVKLQGVY